MRLTGATFWRSVARPEELPNDALPQIAFSGRSNVGKSSLINALLPIQAGRALAHTSSTPGKTRVLNFYLINQRFYFVDLPGYGYAAVPLAQRRRWHSLVENYFKQNGALKGVVALVDSRLGPTDLDMELLLWLEKQRVAVIVAATKADKLSRGQHLQRLKTIKQQLQDLPPVDVVLFSARTGLGKSALWSGIRRLMER